MVRLNGEIIAGMAIAGLGLIFIFAGIVSDAWREIFIADFILVAVGAALITLGVVTIKRAEAVHTESEPGRRRGYF